MLMAIARCARSVCRGLRRKLRRLVPGATGSSDSALTAYLRGPTAAALHPFLTSRFGRYNDDYVLKPTEKDWRNM